MFFDAVPSNRGMFKSSGLTAWTGLRSVLFASGHCADFLLNASPDSNSRRWLVVFEIRSSSPVAIANYQNGSLTKLCIFEHSRCGFDPFWNLCLFERSKESFKDSIHEFVLGGFVFLVDEEFDLTKPSLFVHVSSVS